MIICPEHLVQKEHWKQKGGAKLYIPAAFTQSLLKLKTGAGRWWECGEMFSVVLEKNGFQILIPYFMLDSEPSVLTMGNVKQQRSIRHDQNYGLIVQGRCQQHIITTC